MNNPLKQGVRVDDAEDMEVESMCDSDEEIFVGPITDYELRLRALRGLDEEACQSSAHPQSSTENSQTEDPKLHHISVPESLTTSFVTIRNKKYSCFGKSDNEYQVPAAFKKASTVQTLLQVCSGSSKHFTFFENNSSTGLHLGIESKDDTVVKEEIAVQHESVNDILSEELPVHVYGNTCDNSKDHGMKKSDNLTVEKVDEGLKENNAPSKVTEAELQSDFISSSLAVIEESLHRRFKKHQTAKIPEILPGDFAHSASLNDKVVLSDATECCGKMPGKTIDDGEEEHLCNQDEKTPEDAVSLMDISCNSLLENLQSRSKPTQTGEPTNPSLLPEIALDSSKDMTSVPLIDYEVMNDSSVDIGNMQAVSLKEDVKDEEQYEESVLQTNNSCNTILENLHRRFKTNLIGHPAKSFLDDSKISIGTASFIENEVGCFNDLSGLGKSLIGGNVSTVSADEDGGFLMGLTKVALYHASQSNTPAACKEMLPNKIGEVPAAACVLPITSPCNDGNACDESDVDSSDSFNDTLEEMRLFELYGDEYVMSTSKKFKPSGIDCTVNDNSLNANGLGQHRGLFQEDVAVQPNYNINDKHTKDITPALPALNLENQPPAECNKTTPINAMLPVKDKSAEINVQGNGVSTGIKHIVPLDIVQGKGNTVTPLMHGVTVKHIGKFFKTPSREAPKTKPKVIHTAANRIPTPRRPMKKAYNFIESPVTKYINSPNPSLIANKNMPCPGIKRKFFPEVSAITSHIEVENEDPNILSPTPSLPIKTYKSCPSINLVVEETTRLPHLDSKMQQLIGAHPSVMVLKHEGRVKVGALSSGNSPMHAAFKVAPSIDDSAFFGNLEPHEAEVSVISSKTVKLNPQRPTTK